MVQPEVQRRVPLGDFKHIVIDQVRTLLVDARLRCEIAAGNGFVKRDPTLLIRHVLPMEVVTDIEAVGASAARDFPELGPLAAESNRLAARALDSADVGELVDLYRELMELHSISPDPSPPDNFELVPGSDAVSISAARVGNDPEGSPASTVTADRDDHAFIAATANMAAEARRKARELTQDERAAVASAYRLLDRGVQLPSAYRGIGVYGLRRHQTSLSLANPGEGHVNVTCAHSDLLDGTVVHIEHIDRDGVSDRELVEPYRLPAALNAARVRLHAGAAAPCTAYVGRPIFENGVVRRDGEEVLAPVDFERDLLKTAHTVASACTGMFMNGVADCKIAIERMSYRQAVEFMRAVAGNVVRDPTRQYLSAAFNINIPMWDDRDGESRPVSQRLKIARLGIELAQEGRFDKVTWDGASNQVPSVPIIEQLPFADWVALVHEGHEKGLETYVSAGLVPKHMRDCVFTGVDGVGIGTSLHYRHPQTNAIGQLKPEAIREVLRVRDGAAAEPLGKGAHLLAYWDRLYFEGVLDRGLDAERQALFAGLRDRQEETVAEIVGRHGLPTLDDPGEHPLIAQARRVLASAEEDPVGPERIGRKRWDERLGLSAKYLKSRDIAGLAEALA